MANNEIRINENKLETQFVFFYDLRAKIHNISSEVGCSPNNHSSRFYLRNVENSDLSRFYFSDDFPARMIKMHLHGSDELLEDIGPKNLNKSSESINVFEFRNIPIGLTTRIPDYAFLEVNIFGNGIISLVIRLKNNVEIEDNFYSNLIARPEYIRHQIGPTKPGELVRDVWAYVDGIESDLIEFLNTCTIEASTVVGGTKKPLKILETLHSLALEKPMPHPDNPGEGLLAGETSDSDNSRVIYHRLKRSRPFIGTIADLNNQDLSSTTPRVQSFAIACGRTTPELLDSFVGAPRYLTGSSPPRNIYHPGPSIVFIGRRGWACLKMEDREPFSFHQGVVESVLYVTQSVYGSTRAIKRFVGEILDQGEKVGLVIHTGLHTGMARSPHESSHNAFRDLKPAHINSFTAFLASARLNSPVDDISVLLKSHLTTHTGRAAIERLKLLADVETLADDSRKILESFSASLNDVSQYYRHRHDSILKIGVSISVLALIVTSTSLLYQLFK